MLDMHMQRYAKKKEFIDLCSTNPEGSLLGDPS